MKLERQCVRSIIPVLAILSLVAVLLIAGAADRLGTHGLSFAIVALAVGEVFALPVVGFCGNRTSPMSIFAPVHFERFQRPPPALS
jgi:hypothetical protein